MADYTLSRIVLRHVRQLLIGRPFPCPGPEHRARSSRYRAAPLSGTECGRWSAASPAGRTSGADGRPWARAAMAAGVGTSMPEVSTRAKVAGVYPGRKALIAPDQVRALRIH